MPKALDRDIIAVYADPFPQSIIMDDPTKNRLPAFVFYAMLSLFVFALLVLAFVPGGLSMFVELFSSRPVRELGG